MVTRSLTPSTSRSTASTPCLAALAPCCSTVDATRLIRVTGDCFRADREVFRFVAVERLDFFAADFELPLRRALVFAVVLPREPVRFVTLVVFRRDFAPDDFDRVAIVSSLVKEGTPRPFARFARTVERADLGAFRAGDTSVAESRADCGLQAGCSVTTVRRKSPRAFHVGRERSHLAPKRNTRTHPRT